jgi:hypothetical protein
MIEYFEQFVCMIYVARFENYRMIFIILVFSVFVCCYAGHVWRVWATPRFFSLQNTFGWPGYVYLEFGVWDVC